MHRVHKVALDLNDRQAGHMARAAGTSRFAHNWALARWGVLYEAWKADPENNPRPNQLLIRRELNAVKRVEFPWMSEVTKCAPQEAIIDLGKAFMNFFAGRARHPRFHKKGERDSFRVSSGQFSVVGARLRLPHVGWVRMHEALRWPDAKLLSVTVSRHRGRWFASVACEIPDPAPQDRPGAAVGVDVGTRGYATSNGEIIAVPRALRRAQRRLRRLQQKMARQRKGSKNRDKTKAKLARLHGRVADIRADWLHQTTSNLVDRFSVIGVEDLNVRGMTARPKPKPDPDRPGMFLANKAKAKAGLNKSILDAGFGEFRRQLEYKCPEHEGVLVVIDRWYPSSRLCSACGVKTKHLPLHVRRWACENCGTSHHRDVNAAINLRNYAVSSTVSACGEFKTADPPGHAPAVSSRLCETGTEHQTMQEHV